MINWKFIEHISNQNYCLCCVVHSTLGYSSQQDYTILNSKPEISIPEMSTVLIQIALRWGILVRAQVAVCTRFLLARVWFYPHMMCLWLGLRQLWLEEPSLTSSSYSDVPAKSTKRLAPLKWKFWIRHC